MVKHASELSAVAPGVWLMRRAAPIDLIKQLKAGIEKKKETIASKSNFSIQRLNGLCSVWGGDSILVQPLVNQVIPSISAAMCQIEAINPVADYCDASLFAGSQQYREPTHVHQDITYRWHGSKARYAYTSWLALDRCDERLGALTFSHAFPRTRIEARQDFLAAGFIDYGSTEEWKSSELVVNTDAGDLLVFDSLVWHGSVGVNREGMRRSLAVRWKSLKGWEDDFAIPLPEVDKNTFGMDTSGLLFLGATKHALALFNRHEVLNCPLDACEKFLSHEYCALCYGLRSESRGILEDLRDGLAIQQRYGARINPTVWRSVRDFLIPDLYALANELR